MHFALHGSVVLADLIEIARQYSAEIEYSDENVEFCYTEYRKHCKESRLLAAFLRFRYTDVENCLVLFAGRELFML